ncbi:MAG: polyprenyl synthetase family protein [Bacillota bacterium]|nr:polyprenyl synthetase family protein [Bacillota bacterium]
MSHRGRLDVGEALELDRVWVDAALQRRLAGLEAEGTPGRLAEAIRYAVLGPGKRIRPILAVWVRDLLLEGGSQSPAPAGPGRGAGAPGRRDAGDPLLGPACALELVHAYSLVHDDLPAMDDDDLRRGRPTLHRAFDEATAILAGDALQPLAFAWLAEAAFPPATRVEMMRALARAAGPAGLVGGQQLDLEPAGPGSLEALLELESMKTGALFLACVQVGALAAGSRAEAGSALGRFARQLGLLFQVTDDLLDAAKGEPSSVVTLAGAEEARRLADRLAGEALGALQAYRGEAAERLRRLVELVRNRQG